jgi:hypothetical protein
MAELPPASGVFRAVLQYRQDGQELRNILHFSAAVGILPIGSAGLADALEIWWRANLKPLQSTAIALNAILVQDLGPDAPPAHLRVVTAPVTGTLAGASLPNSVTIAMSLRTAFAGRSFRGRIYHPGMPSSQVTGNNVNAATLTSLLVAYRELINPSGGFWTNAKQLGVLSYYSGGAVRETPVFTPVTEVLSDGIIDNQRRRLPGRGR